MNYKPFNLEAAKRGEPIITDDGQKFTFIAHCPTAGEKQRVLVHDKHGSVWAYDEYGAPSAPFGRHLRMVPKTVFWNIYRNPMRVGNIPFRTREAAEKAGKGPDYVTTIEAEEQSS